MGVDGDMADFAIGSNDVVVERTNLVFKAKLVTDVVPTTITENTDRLFDWIIGRPHHCGWLDFTSLFVWVVHYQATEAAFWSDDAVGARLIGFVVGTNKTSRRLNIHVLELRSSLSYLLNILVANLTLLTLFAVFRFIDIALCVLEHIAIPSHVATLRQNIYGTFSH